jgi:ribonuclease PH
MRTRAFDELRECQPDVPGFAKHAEGSCLVKCGDTHVLVTASLEETTPSFLRGSGKGWVTAEYGMLPRATNTRMRREAAAGKQSGRTQEIQRLIGRSLARRGRPRGAGRTPDHPRLRRAAGRWRHPHRLDHRRLCRTRPVHRLHEKDRHGDQARAQGSCRGGILRHRRRNAPVLDLDYAEDSTAQTDANFVMTGSGGLVEIQGTAEGAPFSDEEFGKLLAAGAQRHRRTGGIAESRHLAKELGRMKLPKDRRSSLPATTRARCARSSTF